MAEINEKIYEELIKIRNLLERIAGSEIHKDLENVATTNQRKRMWSLFNGINSTTEIATNVGVSQRAVQIFVKDLQSKDLVVTERRGYPKRKFDYVPSSWGIVLE